MTQYEAAESQLLAAGDVDGAVEVALRFWTDGPRRSPSDVDPDVREKVREMTTAIYSRGPLDPTSYEDAGLESRIAEIVARTLFLLGGEDVEDVAVSARATAAILKDATVTVVGGAAHHLPMEKPEEFCKVVLAFLHS